MSEETEAPLIHANKSSEVCYICLENCGKDEKSLCVCGAPSHFQCVYTYCMSNQTTRCSICKSEDDRFKELSVYFQYDIDGDGVESTDDGEDRRHVVNLDPRRMLVFTSLIFGVFVLFTSVDMEGKLVLLPPVAYIFMISVSVPLSMACSTKLRYFENNDDEEEESINPLLLHVRDPIREISDDEGDII